MEAGDASKMVANMHATRTAQRLLKNQALEIRAGFSVETGLRRR